MDFAAPTTPAAALIYSAGEMRARAAKARRDADRLIAIAETFEASAWDAEGMAAKFDQWQPKPDDEGVAR